MVVYNLPTLFDGDILPAYTIKTYRAQVRKAHLLELPRTPLEQHSVISIIECSYKHSMRFRLSKSIILVYAALNYESNNKLQALNQ